MLSYILRSIDPELWDDVKARAARDGLPLRAVILALLRGYAAGELAIRGAKLTRNEKRETK
jgi:hypothetical protein